MKLSYRGIDYKYEQPSLEVTEGEILGKYRGANWRCKTLQELPVPQPSVTLKYRGVAYTNQSGAVRSVTAKQMVGVAPAKSVVVPDTLPAREIARIHYANLQRNLEHRLQIAKERGDEALIRLLEAESNQIA